MTAITSIQAGTPAAQQTGQQSVNNWIIKKDVLSNIAFKLHVVPKPNGSVYVLMKAVPQTTASLDRIGKKIKKTWNRRAGKPANYFNPINGWGYHITVGKAITNARAIKVLKKLDGAKFYIARTRFKNFQGTVHEYTSPQKTTFELFLPQTFSKAVINWLNIIGKQHDKGIDFEKAGFKQQNYHLLISEF